LKKSTLYKIPAYPFDSKMRHQKAAGLVIPRRRTRRTVYSSALLIVKETPNLGKSAADNTVQF